MPKKLKLFNGRGHGKWTNAHFFVCAHSQRHAAEMLEQLCGGRGWLREIQIYYSHGCWGTPMKGIEPEIGIWVVPDAFISKDQRPEKIL